MVFIETPRTPGSGALTLTGRQGEVVRESVRTALSWLRANDGRYGLDPAFHRDTDRAHSRFPGAVCRQRWTVRLGEVEPVFGQTGRVVLDITARTAHDGALKWTRAPSTPRAARSIFANAPHRRVRFQRRRIDADRLPDDQTRFRQPLQNPREDRLVRLHVDQPARPRQRRMIRRRLGQLQVQERPQAQ